MSAVRVDDSVINVEPTPCPSCGTTIFVYPNWVGLLPYEEIDGRYPTHNWLTCQLRREIAALRGQPRVSPTELRPAADVAREIIRSPVRTGTAGWAGGMLDDRGAVRLEPCMVFHDAERDVSDAREILTRLIERSRTESASGTARLRLALQRQLAFWEQLPSGVDHDADPANLSPSDAAAHIAGLAVRDAREALVVTADPTSPRQEAR